MSTGLQLFRPTEQLANIMLGTDDVHDTSPESFKFTMTQLNQRQPSTSKPYQEEYHNENIKRRFFDVANKMRHDGVLTDVSLVVEKKLFPAHKLVLCTCSDYFASMFNGPLADHSHEIKLIGLTPNIMEEILAYIYSGMILINEDNIQDILEAACMLLLNDLRDRCARFLRDRLDNSNCLQIFSIARSCSLATLTEFSLDFISAIFQDLVLHEDFKRLNCDDLIEIVSLEDLSVPSEDSVLEAALSWLHFDARKRESKFVDVLKAIHLPFVSDHMLKQIMENDSAIRTSLNLQSVIRSALRLTVENWTSLEESNFNLLEPKAWCSPRQCIQCIPSLIAMGGPTLNLFNSELGRWCEVARCKPRHCPGMDVIGSLIYIVGGSLEWRRKSTGEYYDTESNRWVTIKDMHTPRSNFGLVQLKGKFYAIGGYDGNFPLKSAEVYDPKLDEWTVISDMNRARDGACNTTDGESLYVIGGYDGRDYLLSTEVYRFETRSWDITTIPMTSVKRQNAMCAYYDARIYIIGGYYGDTYHSSMEVLDLETNEWSFASPLSSPRHHAGAAAMNGNVYVCGGWSAQIPVSFVDVYSIAQDTWSRLAPLPTPTMIRSVAVNFPRKAMLNLFTNSTEDMEAYRNARMRSLRSVSESSNGVNDSDMSSVDESFQSGRSF